MGGTSMATPLVAGACALIRQYYTDIQGITTPSAALIKATLINGATDIPGQYPAPDDEIIDSPRPNYAEGWGRVNVANSIFPTPPRVLEYLDETSSFTSTGERRGITFQNNSAVPLAVTLVWTDYPSTPTAFFNLVNDLDIILTDPGGATHYPNGFGTSEGINTVEVIDIPVAQVGQYTVIVQAYNIPQGPQPFAVVACGDIASWAVHYPPNGPTDLVATAVSSSQVNLSWTDNATDENGFKIERKTGDGGAYSPIDMVPADVISYSDTTVSPGQLYYYRVCAYNVYGDSSSSNEAAAVTPGGHFGLTGSDSGGGGCFIATAAYGSPDGSCIDLLRAFRDKYLVANYIGKKWVDLYYRYSPIMAGFIADHPAMRKGVRLILFPFVAFSAGMVHTTALQKGLIFCPILGLLLGMVVLSKRRTFNRHVLKR
jgi:hypothetical protein